MEKIEKWRKLEKLAQRGIGKIREMGNREIAKLEK